MSTYWTNLCMPEATALLLLSDFCARESVFGYMYFRVHSARTGILRCRMTPVERVHCKSISSARQWCAVRLCATSSSHQIISAARSGRRHLHCKLYLAEDRVPNKRKMGCELFFLTTSPSLDLVLGTGVEARRVVGNSLCQVGAHRHRYSGSGVCVCVGGVVCPT